MAHVIAVRDGVPVLAVGAPGGRRIMDTCLQMTIDVIDFGMDIQSACAAPLIDCSGPELLVDDRIAAETRDRLRAMGHNVVDVEVSFSPRGFASPTGVTVDPRTGIRYGGADPFGAGIAAVFKSEELPDMLKGSPGGQPTRDPRSAWTVPQTANGQRDSEWNQFGPLWVPGLVSFACSWAVFSIAYPCSRWRCQSTRHPIV